VLHALLLFSVAVGLGVLLLAVFSLAATPRLSRAGPLAPPKRWPFVSVIIPARNEQREVEAAVRSHLAQDFPDFEVIVVEDCSTDATPRILERLAVGEPRLRVVPGREPLPGWLGKPHALHLGAQKARGELLLFVDADVRYDPRTLREAVTFLAAHRLDFLALLPQFVMRGFWENVLMPFLPLVYFSGPAILANSDRVRWLGAGGGAGNLVRRRAYEEIGGHAALRGSVIDDVGLACRAKRAGFRCRGVLSEDRVSVRMYRGFREIWNGFTKNIAYAFQGWLGALFLFLTIATTIPALLPSLVLLSALMGAPVASTDAVLATIAFATAVAARTVVALAFHGPIWPAPTHPLMAAVWTGIIGRSLYWKLVRREVRWRGRRYDAEVARF
jgi:chlorobactene glucosyltransferase